MSVGKWIPGPWRTYATGFARSGKPEHEIHWPDDGECIAEIVHGIPEANLIAAAPEIYEALSSLVSLHVREMEGLLSVMPTYEDWDKATDVAADALAKARGES